MTYSISFRRKVLSVREKENLSIAQVAKSFLRRDSQCDALDQNSRPRTTRNKPSTKIDMGILAQDVKNHPHAHQYERAKQLGVST
ncbi:IS630 transposase-related protein [Nitrosomonas communis]|uniref:Transposase n=1 Tax=Nitrosomonas communis TaxID=44574 RepID=A0A1I4IPG3_9PROT|nr:IS630 transposase-related protein [Nitrosomonas communis]SFL56165.1 Transposase [Nitrosomonas communis]